MGQPLKARLKQNSDFRSKGQEAALSLMVAAVHLRRKHERMFRRYDLNFSYYNVLRILRGGPEEGYPRCEIIGRMIDPAPDVTRLIDHLIAKGWVLRERSDEDRRISLHWLTDSGKALLEAIDNEIESLTETFAGVVGEEDLDHLIRICSDIFSSEALGVDC